MRYLPLIGLFLILSSYSGAAQFSCPQKGTVTIWKEGKRKPNQRDILRKTETHVFGFYSPPQPQAGVGLYLEM